MKKTIIKAIIVSMASALLLVSAGCGGSGNDNASNPGGTNPLFPGISTSSTTQTPTTTLPSTAPATSVPVETPPTTTSIPSPTGTTVNAAYVGTYYGAIDPNVFASLTEEEKQYYQSMMSNTYMSLGADGSISGMFGGQSISGSWNDAGNSQVNLIINGQTLTYTIQNGRIYDPDDTSSYFEKR